MIQLGNRCATVVAKWSRSQQRTCSSPQKAHKCLSDVPMVLPKLTRNLHISKKYNTFAVNFDRKT